MMPLQEWAKLKPSWSRILKYKKDLLVWKFYTKKKKRIQKPYKNLIDKSVDITQNKSPESENLTKKKKIKEEIFSQNN